VNSNHKFHIINQAKTNYNLSYNDYYPYGMLVPKCNYSNPVYRYGFQGQEKDNEIKGIGNSINYKFRMHDPRVGRFFAVDPLAKKYPWNSSYAFSENRVIDGVELEGLEVEQLNRFIEGVSNFFKGIFQLKEVCDNNMLDPNVVIEQENYEMNNPEAEHISTVDEASNNIVEGLEDSIKGGVQGVADLVEEFSDDSIITLEAVTITYPMAAEATAPVIGVLSVASTSSTLVSASVDYSDGNDDAGDYKVASVGINSLFTTAGKEAGKFITKEYKATEKTEKLITINTTNILADWFYRTFMEVIYNQNNTFSK